MKRLISETAKAEKNSRLIIKKYQLFLSEDLYDCALAEEASLGGVVFSHYTGITKEMLPQADSLSLAQIDALVDALLKLYKSYGLNPLFHPQVSSKIMYMQMRDFCEELIYPNIDMDELVDVEFCDYEAFECPYSKCCALSYLLTCNCMSYKYKNEMGCPN